MADVLAGNATDLFVRLWDEIAEPLMIVLRVMVRQVLIHGVGRFRRVVWLE